MVGTWRTFSMVGNWLHIQLEDIGLKFTKILRENVCIVKKQ